MLRFQVCWVGVDAFRWQGTELLESPFGFIFPLFPMKDPGDNADGSQGKSLSERCMMYDIIVFENLHFPFSRVSRALCSWDRFQKPAVLKIS